MKCGFLSPILSAVLRKKISSGGTPAFVCLKARGFCSSLYLIRSIDPWICKSLRCGAVSRVKLASCLVSTVSVIRLFVAVPDDDTTPPKSEPYSCISWMWGKVTAVPPPSGIINGISSYLTLVMAFDGMSGTVVPYHTLWATKTATWPAYARLSPSGMINYHRPSS